MTDKEKIKAEIERRMKAYNLEADIASAEDAIGEKVAQGKYDVCIKLLDFINSIEEPVSPCVECASISEGCKEICYDYNKWVRDNHKEESVSEELEDFALQYAGHHAPYDDCMQEVEDAIKAGAKWDREKTINKTCEWIKSMWSETDDRFKDDYTGMLIEDFKKYMEGE